MKAVPKPASRKAFTLVEILAATAIMTIIVASVMGIVTDVMGAWNRASSKLTATSEARMALDVIAQDLQGAMFDKSGTQWLKIQVANEGPGRSNNTALMFFTVPVDRDRKKSDGTEIPGDVCAVSYRLAYQNPFRGGSAGQRVFGLYRAVVSPEQTFNGPPSGGLIAMKDLYGSFWRGAEGTGTQSTINPIGLTNLLATNVVAFRVAPYLQLSDGKIAPMRADRSAGGLPLETGDYLSVREIIEGRPDVTGGKTAVRVAYADVSLTILTEEGLKLLNEPGRTMSSVEFEELVSKYGYAYTRRVYFINTPL